MMLRALILCSLPALAGCVTTDSAGNPIARDVKGKGMTLEAAMANATLDGSRIVASGRPGSVSFLYPGAGRLAIRDLNTNYIPFSIEPSAEPGPKTLISITADGKVTGTVSGANSPSVTEVAQVDKAHVYVITYQATTATPAPTTPER